MKLIGGGNQWAPWTLLTCAVLAGFAALGSSWALASRAQIEVQVSSGLTPQAPAAETEPSEGATPEVTAVDPPRVSPGGQASLKITGKNFAEGVKVSFSNPGIRVFETSRTKTTELTTRIQIAADAPTGKSSLFVVNPGDREVEVPFEVTGSAPAAPAAPTSGPTAQRFEVYNLGEVASILRSSGKTKGTLVLSGSKLAYEEGGQEVFSVPLSDIKEVDLNSIAGFNTGTFHLILKSGKTYNFVAASLRPADSRAVVDSLRRTPP